MTGWRRWAGTMLVCGLAGAIGCGIALPARAHTPTPVMHTSPPPHHAHYAAHGAGWHGYHHGYGFYGFWPWYFPLAYGYATPYYGSSFLVETQASYTATAPENSGIVQPSTSWYYCRDPEGYFPYVKTCASGWQTVPAQPVPPAPASVAPAN